MRKRLSSAALLVALSAAVLAHAHELPIERSMLVQVSQDRVEMMVVYSEPPGPRTDRLLAKYDLNRNGTIDEKELTIAAGPLTRRALLGLQTEVVGERPKMREPDIKFKRERGGGASVALYVRYDLPNAAARRTFQLRVLSEKGVPSVQTLVEAGEGMKLVASPAPHDEQATTALRVEPGDQLTVVFEAHESPRN